MPTKAFDSKLQPTLVAPPEIRSGPAVGPSLADERSPRRASLLDARRGFVESSAAAAAQDSLDRHLNALLDELEPESLGLYWAVRGEFNLAGVVQRIKGHGGPIMSLPFAYSGAAAHAAPAEKRMEYRRWDGHEPALRDECGIRSTAGAPVSPDVVLVPCVGFTRAGFRLGYGGGYFDRWLASRPEVTAIGVAWSGSEMDEASFAAQPHDVPLAAIVTELGIVAG